MRAFQARIRIYRFRKRHSKVMAAASFLKKRPAEQSAMDAISCGLP
jgi:hypothetical protein